MKNCIKRFSAFIAVLILLFVLAAPAFALNLYCVEIYSLDPSTAEWVSVYNDYDDTFPDLNALCPQSDFTLGAYDYFFEGWFDGPSPGYNDVSRYFGDPLDSNILVYGVFVREPHQSQSTYTITFNSNGGSSISSLTNKTSIPSNINTAYVPTKSGYTFAGWYTDSGLTTAVTPGASLSGNITLYAKWSQVTYSIAFNSNGGSSISTLTNKTSIPSNINTAYVPTKSGYTFAGWYTDSGLTTAVTPGASLSGNITLYAKWSQNTYDITFEKNGGIGIGFADGLTAIPLDIHTNSVFVPTKSGYTFDGWYIDSGLTTSVTPGALLSGNITLYAKWVEDVTYYSVNVYLDDLNTPSAFSSSVSSGYQITSSDFAVFEAWGNDTGYTFVGVYYDSGYTVAASVGDTITANTSLYVKRVLSVYSIAFDSNGGSSISTLTGQTSVPSNINTFVPTKSGYTFAGWYTDSGLTTAVTPGSSLSGNITLYASWSQFTYSITFNSNYGSSISTLTGQTSIPSNINTSYLPTRTNYVFLGWYTNATLTTAVTPGSSLSGNITLYAKWSHEVIWDPEGGVLNNSTEDLITYYDQLPRSLPFPYRDGYTFIGWYYQDDVLATSDDIIGVSSVTLYAHWISNAAVGTCTYEDGYRDAQADNNALKTIVNEGWSSFYSSFQDFTNNTTIGGITIISLLATLVVICLCVVVLKIIFKS